MSRRVERFEFELAYGGETIWTQLQGHGGQHGNEYVCAINSYVDNNNTAGADHYMRQACDRLLSRARRQLEKEGCVYIYDYHADEPDRIERQVPSEIVSVRPVFGPVTKGAA